MDIGSIGPNVSSTVQTASASSSVSVEEAAQRRQLISAARTVNQSNILGQESELTFRVEPGARRAIMEIVDRKTREVVQEIPPEYVLRLSEDLARGQRS